MFLGQAHRAKLEACGITEATWTMAGIHSGTEAETRTILGFGVGTGLVIPYDADHARVRIDHPGPDGKCYRSPKGSGNRLYVPKTLDASVLQDPGILLYVTEGEFKALKATQEGFPCVALPGVWSWKTQLHGKSLTISDLDLVVWKDRRTILVFDSDLADKPQVAWAEHALCQELRARGAQVFVLRLPDGPRGERLGLDDYLVRHGAEAFKQLPMQALHEADREWPTFLKITDLADAYLLRVLQPHHRIKLGYAELDDIVRGLAPGEMMTVLGRSSVGKTTFALNLIEHMSADGSLPTLMFSLEQPGLELFERMASMTVGWSGKEIEERARIEDPVFMGRMLEVCAQWKHVVVVEKPCILDQINGLIEAARVSDLWAEPLRLVVVDYMGLVGQRRQSSPYEQMSLVAKELKTFAKRHRVALVALCQVDREGGSGGELITLKMARDSGVVEEAADYLLGIWRPELAERKTKEEREAARGEFKIRVLKNRSGPAPKTVTLQFEPTTLRICPAESLGVAR